MSSRLRRVLRPYIGDVVQRLPLDQLSERELVCLVVRLQGFEHLLERLELQRLGGFMSRYYSVIVEAVMHSNGDINEFCGETIRVYYGNDVGERALLYSVIEAFRTAQDTLEAELGARIGVGICRGRVIYGAFGTQDRLTVTAFGPCIVCAEQLANEERAFGICESLAYGLDDTLFPAGPWVTTQPHWHK